MVVMDVAMEVYVGEAYPRGVFRAPVGSGV